MEVTNPINQMTYERQKHTLPEYFRPNKLEIYHSKRSLIEHFYIFIYFLFVKSRNIITGPLPCRFDVKLI